MILMSLKKSIFCRINNFKARRTAHLKNNHIIPLRDDTGRYFYAQKAEERGTKSEQTNIKFQKIKKNTQKALEQNGMM